MKSIVSIGQAAALIQQMPGRIRAAANDLAIQPTMRINGIDHFSESDVQAIGDLLRRSTSGNSQPTPNSTGATPMATATRAAGEQVRSLLRSPQMSRQQLDAYKSSCRLVGDPEPSGFRNGQPFWATASVVEWAAGAKRSRSGIAGYQCRGMVATLLRRGIESQDKQRASVDEVLADIASEKIKTPAAAEKAIDAAGLTAKEIAPQLRTIEARKRAVADRQRAQAARSEAEELQGEMDLLQAEMTEWWEPRQARLDRLAEEKLAAQRRSMDLTTTKVLRDSAPAWLVTAESAAKAAIQSAEQRGQYLASQVRDCRRNIAQAEDELSGLPGRITLLAAKVSDWEGQQEAKKLERRKAELETLIKRSTADLAEHHAEQKSMAGKRNKLQRRLSRIGELMLEVWPSPADLAD